MSLTPAVGLEDLLSRDNKIQYKNTYSTFAQIQHRNFIRRTKRTNKFDQDTVLSRLVVCGILVAHSRTAKRAARKRFRHSRRRLVVISPQSTPKHGNTIDG